MALINYYDTITVGNFIASWQRVPLSCVIRVAADLDRLYDPNHFLPLCAEDGAIVEKILLIQSAAIDGKLTILSTPGLPLAWLESPVTIKAWRQLLENSNWPRSEFPDFLFPELCNIHCDSDVQSLEEAKRIIADKNAMLDMLQSRLESLQDDIAFLEKKMQNTILNIAKQINF